MIFSNMKNRAKGDNFTASDRYNLRSDEENMRFDGCSNSSNKKFKTEASEGRIFGTFALGFLGARQNFGAINCASFGKLDAQIPLDDENFVRGGLVEKVFKFNTNMGECQPSNACKNITKCDKIRHSAMRDIGSNLGGVMSDITKGNFRLFKDNLTDDEQAEFDIVERCVDKMAHLEDGVVKSVDRLGKSVLGNAEKEGKFKKMLRKIKGRCRSLGEGVLCCGGSASASVTYGDGFCGDEIYHYYKRGERGLYNGVGSPKTNISAGVFCSKLKSLADDEETQTCEIGQNENEIGQSESELRQGESNIGQIEGEAEQGESGEFCYPKASEVGQGDGEVEYDKGQTKQCSGENEWDENEVKQSERDVWRGDGVIGRGESGVKHYNNEVLQGDGVIGRGESRHNNSEIKQSESEIERGESGEFCYPKASEVSIGQKCDDYLFAVGGLGNFDERESEKSFSKKMNFKNFMVGKGLTNEDLGSSKGCKNEDLGSGNECGAIKNADCRGKGFANEGLDGRADSMASKNAGSRAEGVTSRSTDYRGEGFVSEGLNGRADSMAIKNAGSRAESVTSKSADCRGEGFVSEGLDGRADSMASVNADDRTEGDIFIDVTGEVKDVQPIVRSCELLNMWLDKRKINSWGQKEWVKFFIKVEPCIDMCIDYYDRLVERFATNSARGEAYANYGSAENMFETMIDLIERKKEYLRLKFFVDRLNRELDDVDKLIIGYFVFGEEENREKLLEVISRKTIYRRANSLIAKLSDFCERRGYTPSWCLEQFGGIARR